MSAVSQISDRAAHKSAEALLVKAAVSLGNSFRTPEHDVADLINDYIARYGAKGAQKIADLAQISVATVERYGREGGTSTYKPWGDTTWRLIRVFGGEVSIKGVHITPKYQNKPKDDR